MKLLSISQVKNESDFIERFVRVHSELFDEMHFVDDRSVDQTVSILAALKEEGLPVFVHSLDDREARVKYMQNKTLTALMRRLARLFQGQQGFIFPLDADELIFNTRSGIEQSLLQVPPNSFGLMAWKTFIPVHGGLSPHRLLKDSFSCLAHEQQAFHKVVVPSKYATTAELGMGNHTLVNGSQDLSPYVLDFPLCHFPVRSSGQLICKALLTSHKTFLKLGPNSTENYHAFRVAESVRAANYHVSDDLLADLAFDYLGGEVQREFQALKEFSEFQETLPKYPGTPLNPIAALDEFLADLTAEIRMNAGSDRQGRRYPQARVSAGHSVVEVVDFVVAKNNALCEGDSAALDLGSGGKPRNPFRATKVYGVDINKVDGKWDHVVQSDLSCQPIPFEEASFHCCSAYDFIEHIPRIALEPSGPQMEMKTFFPFVRLMNEIYRVLVPNGYFVQFTPAYPAKQAFQDPTHVNIITEDTMPAYFCATPNYRGSPIAKMYGFEGKFELVDQIWAHDVYLVTLMKAVK